jgi:hypothetical protein
LIDEALITKKSDKFVKYWVFIGFGYWFVLNCFEDGKNNGEKEKN